MDWIPAIGAPSYKLKVIWSKLWIEEDGGRAETIGIDWVDWKFCYNGLILVISLLKKEKKGKKGKREKGKKGKREKREKGKKGKGKRKKGKKGKGQTSKLK